MQKKKSRVFKETYENYLGEIDETTFAGKTVILGTELSGNQLLIPFFNQIYSVSSRGVLDSENKDAPFPVSVVLLKYILMCPRQPVQVEQGDDPLSDWVTFRDFKDAGPLTSYFTSNTNKTIEQAFSNRLDLLQTAANSLGANQGPFASSYDVSLAFKALPRLPVVLNFNAADEEFPARSSVLFRRSSEHYLDMECVAIIGTFLAGKLLLYLS